MHNITQGQNNEQQLYAVDWNEIADLGLLQRINREIMNPLGLAVYRDPSNGTSGGAMIADDGVWEYSPEITNKILDDDEVVVRVSEMVENYKQMELQNENTDARE